MKTLPISVYQERFWLEWMLKPQGAAYNLPLVYRIEGELDHEELQEACTWIMNHYEPFQAYFNSDGSEQYQGEYTPQDYFQSLTMEEAEAEAFMRELIATPFDLTQGPLAKFYLIQHHQGNTYHFVMLFHHIIVDAMAMSLLVRDLSAVYSALVLDQPIPNSSLQSFQQCVESERSVQTASWRKAASSFWQDFLGELPLSVPLSSQPTTTTDAKIGSHYFSLSAADSQGLKALASQYGTTPFTLLAAVYGIVLSRYAGQSTLLISYPVNMRPQGFEQTAGCFVNNVPLKLELTAGQSFRALVLSLNEQRKVVRPYQGYPLTNILHDRWQALGIRDETYLNVGMVDTNLNAEALGLVNTQTEALPISSAEGTYDWCLLYDLREEGGIGLRIDYKTSVFDSALVRQWVGHYEHVLQGVLAQPDINHSDIALLTASEYEELVYGWNQTAASYPQDKTVHELFEDQVVRTPEKVAVVFEGEELTYGELNGRANQLARSIQKAYQGQTGESLRADTLIGICVEASLDMVIGILGILKSGGGYVPIDPAYPAERIQYMLADTRAQVLLTQSNLSHVQSVSAPGQEAQGDSLRDLLPGHISMLYLDQAACYAEESASNLSPVSGSHDLAYVIYTSGSTGKPKGVMVEHRSVVNRLYWMQHTYQFDEKDKVLQKTSYGFDVSVWEILLPLLSGSQLVISAPGVYRDPQALIEKINHYKVTKLHFVPSMLAVFMEAMLKTDEQLLSVPMIFCSGEALPFQLITKVKSRYPAISIHNLYGPTETAIDVTYYNDIQLGNEVIPIGRPLWNISVYILDTNHQPVPIGVSGELYIGGVGVARGYLNQDELTRERFIVNPFASQEDKSQGRNLRLYKTGDLVKWLPDGNLVYLGRTDFQVKLRGYRIEIGEIEAVLSGYKGIAQCVVVMHEAKEEKNLVAYYVLDAGTDEVIPDTLRSYLQTKLPEYMVPPFFVPLEKLPLTVNGKVDRKALPEPDVSGQIAQGYVAPRTETEYKLCEVWRKVLRLDRVGAQDNFFHIGGHSLIAVQICNRLSQSFSIPMPVKALFDNPTIRQLGHYVEEQQSKTDSVAHYTLPTIEPHAEAWYEPFPLTPVQQAYLLGRESLFTLGNIATHVYIVFRFAQLDVGRLEQAWNTLIKRHLALRTVFEAGQQRFLDSVPAYTIRVYKLEDEASAVVQQTLDTIQDEMSHQVFDPTEYPLFDLRVSQLPEEFRLHCSFDILLVDGFSMMLLFDELTTLYQEPAACLPPIEISFRDYILELESLKESERYKQDQQYWQAKLPTMPFGPALALQKQPAEVKQPVFARLTKTIDSSIWQAFKGKAASYHISPTSALLAIYGLVLGRWSTSQRFLINLTLFNRLPLHEQVNELVGDFTTLELLTFAWSPDQSFKGLVKQTQDNLWEDLDHRLFTGVEVQRELLRLHQLGFDQALAPVVLTSMPNLSLSKEHAYFVDRSYQGIAYSITQTSQVWLDNKAYEADGHFIAEWDYVSELFDPDTIHAMHTAYCQLIEHFAVHDWTERIPEILPAPMLATVEAANATDHEDILPTQTLAGALVVSAERYPTNVAVLDPTGALSYQRLLSRSYQVAHWLEAQGVERHELVAVCAERSWQQVVACLGVMLSGAAYLPLNIEWPLARLEEVLQEGEVRIVLTTEKQLG